MSNKELTPAQQQELKRLNQNLEIAQMYMRDFVNYLRVEHGATAGEWTIEDIHVGFVPTAQPETENRENVSPI